MTTDKSWVRILIYNDCGTEKFLNVFFPVEWGWVGNYAVCPFCGASEEKRHFEIASVCMSVHPSHFAFAGPTCIEILRVLQFYLWSEIFTRKVIFVNFETAPYTPLKILDPLMKPLWTNFGSARVVRRI